MKKLLIAFIFILPQLVMAELGEKVSVGDYESNEQGFLVPVSDKDLKTRVRAKNSTRSVIHVLSELKGDINKAAKLFNLDPIHVAAAIAGEHAMNVDMFDAIQQYYIQRDRYLDRWVQRHREAEDDLYTMIQEPNFDKCESQSSDYYYWYCVAKVWFNDPSYKVGRFAWPSKHGMYRAFTDRFFNPDGMGSTFGVGQMSPLRALMMTDRVAAKTKISRLKFREDGDIAAAYNEVLDPEKVVYYIAATVSFGIDAYRQIAHFDISQNPGLTATLYNLGQETIKASARKRKCLQSIRKHGRIDYPETNKLGKWVNKNIDVIREAIQ